MKQNRRTLMGKLVQRLTIFAMVPTLLFLLIIQANNVLYMRQTAKRQAQNAAERINKQVDAFQSDISNTASILVNEHTFLKASKSLSKGVTIGEEIDIYKYLLDYIFLSTMNSNVDFIRIYLPDSELVTKQRVNIFGLSDLNSVSMPQGLKNLSSASGWMRDADGNMVYICRATYLSRGESPMLFLTVSPTSLQSILDESGVQAGIRIQTSEDILYSNESTVGTTYDVTFTDDLWKVTLFIPTNQFRVSSVPMYVAMLVVVLMSLLMIPLLARTVSRPLTNTIREVAEANKAILRLEYPKLQENSDIEEFVQLQRAHNQTIDYVQTMIHNVYELQHEKDQAELTSLFEQVKPHFLYNTLDSVRWLATLEKAPRSAEFLEQLSSFYRISLNKSHEFVPLWQELQHVEEYIKLMQLRYADTIQLETDIADDCQEALVLRLLLQPLVENAIEHGLHGSTKEGCIHIRARIENNIIRLEVCDNGTGMDESLRRSFNESGTSSGYGLENIQRRLKVYYGERAGIQLDEADGGGVSVHVWILMQAKA